MQSTVHEAWAREQSGKLRAGWLAYNLTRAFATFPWPSVLVDYSIGDRLYQVRNAVLASRNICLTDLYNAVHDPLDTSNDVNAIRRLHEELDLAVTTAYGWNDIDLGRDFRKVPYLPDNDRVRFTISEPARLEILQRLAILNRQRHAEQQSSGAALSSSPDRGSSSQDRRSRVVTVARSDSATPDEHGTLFERSKETSSKGRA